MPGQALAALFAVLSLVAFAQNAAPTAPMTPAVASDVVKGFISGFTDGEALLPGEEQCLETTAGGITADLQKGLMDMVAAIKDATNRQDLGNKLMVDGIQTFTLIENLMNTCLKGDAKKDIDEAVAHLEDVKAMGQNIAANRISIEQDAITAITDGLGKQWQGTGKAIGEALRMVLLDTRGAAAPNSNIISAFSVDRSGGPGLHMMNSSAIRIPAVLMVTAVALAVFIGLVAVKVVRRVDVDISMSSVSPDIEDADEHLVE